MCPETIPGPLHMEPIDPPPPPPTPPTPPPNPPPPRGMRMGTIDLHRRGESTSD